MSQHKQVTVTGEIDGRPETAEVDEELADFIKLLWQLNISTMMSCQDNRGKVWIDFPYAFEAESFLNLMAPDPANMDDLESIDSRVVGIYEPDDWGAYRSDRMWSYATSVADLGLNFPWGGIDDDDGEIERDSEPMFIFSISVRFPKADLPEVMQRLQVAADARG